MPSIEARHIAVRYGALEAVHDVSFRVEQGAIVALIGSNGAGKSSSLKALMGLQALSAGSLLFDGEPFERSSAAERVARGIALSPEGRRLFPRMSVWENLQVGAHTVASAAQRRLSMELVCALFPVVAERRGQMAGSLSGGEQQMVAIGRALMSAPKVLLLDEPSLGIAPKVVAEIGRAIVRINRETGMSILLVEQNARLALRLSGHAYVLEQGRVIRSGGGQALLADPFVRKAYLGL